MSRIGRLPIPVPSGVEVTIAGPDVTVKGPKGTLALTVRGADQGREGRGRRSHRRPSGRRARERSLHGLTRTLVSNMVVGVTQGYEKKMEIAGVGYRVVAKGSDLEFALGYSHPVLVTAPDGITFTVEAPTRFSVSGIDKQKVGEVAANIRKLRKPDPYKGKGVRYAGEVVRRKVGKAGK